MSDLQPPTRRFRCRRRVGPHLDKKPHAAGAIAFLAVSSPAVFAFAAYQRQSAISPPSASITSPTGAFVLLGIALLIALGFEFVNGFHDTANAVATVIYTHSLPAPLRRYLVRLFQLPRRPDLLRSRRLHRRHPAPRRADPPGRLRRRLRHDLRPPHRCHHLEPRHLGHGPAQFLISRPHRLHHGRRPREPVQ